MCFYLRSVVIQDVVLPEGICVAVNGEMFWARNQRRYKRYAIIPDVVISEVYCMQVPNFLSISIKVVGFRMINFV